MTSHRHRPARRHPTRTRKAHRPPPRRSRTFSRNRGRRRRWRTRYERARANDDGAQRNTGLGTCSYSGARPAAAVRAAGAETTGAASGTPHGRRGTSRAAEPEEVARCASVALLRTAGSHSFAPTAASRASYRSVSCPTWSARGCAPRRRRGSARLQGEQECRTYYPSFT